VATLPVAIDARKARAGAAQFNRAADSMTVRATRVGAAVRNMFIGLSAGLIVRNAIKTIAGFEETMATVGAVTRATQKDFAELEMTARTLGATTRFSAQEAAEGLLFLARAGFETNEAILALPDTLDLAAAGALDLGTAADIASNILSQFNIDAGQTSRVVDTLVVTSNRANTNVLQLAEAFKLAGPVAGALGISVEKTAAALGVLGDRGVQGSLAGTNLRGVLSALLAPTGRARRAIRGLGIEIQDLNPDTNDLVDIFQKFKDAGLSAADAVAIFGRRNAAAALIFADSTQRMAELTQANIDNRGEAERVAKTMNDTLAGAFRNVKSAIEELFLATGDAGLTGGLKSLLFFTADVIRVLAGMEGSVKNNIVVATFFATLIRNLAILLGIMAAIKVAVFFQALAVSIALATKRAAQLLVTLAPLLAILAVLAGAITFGKFLFDQFKFVQQGAAILIQGLNALWELLVLGFKAAIVVLKVAWVELVAFLKNQLAEGLDFIADSFGEFAPKIAAKLKVAAVDLRAQARPTQAVAGEAGVFGEREVKPGREPLLEQIRAVGQVNVNELNDIRTTFQSILAKIEEDFQGADVKPGNILDTAKDAAVLLGAEVKKVSDALIAGLFPDIEGFNEAIVDSMGETGAAGSIRQATEAAKDMTEVLKKQKQVADSIGESFAANFETVIFQSQSAKDALNAFFEEVIRQTFRILVTQQIASAISTGLSGGFGGAGGPTVAKGGVFSGGRMTTFAHGGIVNGPTTFPLSGGRTGLMGEAGPEAIIPLRRGPGGRLGVEAPERGQAVTVNMTVIASDADSFRRSKRQILGGIKRSVR